MLFLHSMRGRLILSLVVSLLLVTLVVIGFSFYQADKMVKENRGELLSQLAKGMAYQLSKDMQSRSHEIQMLAELTSVKDFTAPVEQKRAVFEKMRASYPHYAWIGMTDAQGNIIVGTDGLLVGKNVKSRKWFVQGRQGVHFGSVHDAFLLSKIMPKPKWDDLPLRLVDVAAPILNDKGTFVGVIVGHLGWDWAFEMRAKMLASPSLKNVDLLVAKSDGSLLMGTEDLPSASINLLQQPFFEQALKQDRGFAIERWHDQQLYMSAASFEQSSENTMLKWVVIAKERLDSGMLPVEDLKLKIIIILLLGMLALVWFVWRIVSQSTQGLEALTKAANDINHGKTEVSIPTYKVQDEVGILSRSLSKLITRLQGEIFDKTQVANQLQLMARVHDDSPQGIVITDKDKRILSVNQAFVEVTGYSQEECLGLNPSILSSGRHGKEFYNQLWFSVEQTGRWQGEVWNRNKSGGIYPEWLLISALKNPQGEVTHYIGIFSDITDKKEAENQLVFLANHDVLTQLPNRRLLQDVINQAITYEPDHLAGLIFLDLDFFKSINDSLGHVLGDQLLQIIAARLQQQFQQPNLVARFGGDEFVIFIPNIQDVSELEVTAQMLVKLFESPFVFDEYSLQIGASMGVSVYPRDGDNAHSLIQAADTAMYDLKRSRTQSYQFYSASMRKAAFDQLLLERDLKRALEKNEFYLVYQPQIDLDSRRLKGMEALMRWKHPERGEVSPGVFIPIIEKMGIIDSIGLWVIQESLRQYKIWTRAYSLEGVTISINLSAIQLRNPNFPDLLKSEVERSSVPCDQVIFEVTESVVIEDDLRIMNEFDKLREAGCHLALDDYGTGYSNLSYIDKFNLSELKIDQAFIKKIQSNESDKLIVHHTIEMAKGLGMTVVAEGVETEAQIEALQAYSNIIVQGYYFDKPLTVEAMNQRLSDQTDLKWPS